MARDRHGRAVGTLRSRAREVKLALVPVTRPGQVGVDHPAVEIVAGDRHANVDRHHTADVVAATIPGGSVDALDVAAMHELAGLQQCPNRASAAHLETRIAARAALPQPAPAQVREAAVARPLAAACVAVLAVTGAAEGLSSVMARILVEPSVLRICRADRPRLDAVARDRRPVCASRAVAVAAAGLRATRVELRL